MYPIFYLLKGDYKLYITCRVVQGCTSKGPKQNMLMIRSPYDIWKEFDKCSKFPSRDATRPCYMPISGSRPSARQVLFQGSKDATDGV